MQQSPNLSCSHCQHLYDLETHLPRSLPNCGHSICSVCLNSLIDKAEPFKCPLDETIYFLKDMSFNDFKVNTLLKELLEAPLNENMCKIHRQELRVRCLTDGSRICHQCSREETHKDHITKPIEQIVSESQSKVEVLENSIQDLTGYFELVSKKIEDMEKEILEVINSNCEKFATKDERKIATVAHVKTIMKKEREALEELLGAGSTVKMNAVKKIVFLKSLTLETMKDDLKEEELDITKYLKLVSKTEFDKHFKELEKKLDTRKDCYYFATDLYKMESFRVTNMNSTSIVKSELNYLTGKTIKRRINVAETAKKGWFKGLMFTVILLALLYLAVITGLAKPFGKDLSKFKWFKDFKKVKGKGHDHKASKDKKKAESHLPKPKRGRRFGIRRFFF